MQQELCTTNDGRVMADFVALCSEKDEERFLLFVLSLPAFTGDFWRCDHSIRNLIIYKNFYSRPYKIETMGVCLVTGGKSH